MSATDAFEAKILELWLDNVGAANIGDATGLRGSTTAGSMYVSLASADPGESGTQTTSELAYGSYARVAVARGSAWTTSSGATDNAAAITFPACTSSSGTAAYAGLGSATSGTGNLDFSAAANSLAISTGITPQIAIGAFDITLN